MCPERAKRVTSFAARTREELMTEQQQQEQRTREAIKVRQVTDYQASWTERERGAPGAFTFQLILDNGAEEYVIHPTADDADVLIDLFEQTDTIYFDMERRVLIFGDVSAG
jgi:hypothetical protein